MAKPVTRPQQTNTATSHFVFASICELNFTRVIITEYRSLKSPIDALVPMEPRWKWWPKSKHQVPLHLPSVLGPTMDFLAPLQFFNGLSMPEITWIQKVTFQLHVESTWVWGVHRSATMNASIKTKKIHDAVQDARHREHCAMQMKTYPYPVGRR